ncbi:MAG: ABC transporter ATP-binding protein [Pseudomonadota bacterium]
MLHVDQLSARYGGISALVDVSLDVHEGTIACLLGANGAGKSTLLNAIMGRVPAVTGRVIFEGIDILGRPTEAIVAGGIALVPEGRQLFGDLTVEDNLYMGAYARGGPETDDLDEIYALFPRLRERRLQLAKTLSGGEQQMVAIGRALMSRPRLMLLDEPSLGLAPILVREVMRLVTTINRQGITILLVEQNARQALRIARDAFVLEKGRMVMSGPADELAEDPRITNAYLGAEAPAL